MEDKLDLKELVGLSFATSIDALAVGISFAFLQVRILPSVACIGVDDVFDLRGGRGDRSEVRAKYQDARRWSAASCSYSSPEDPAWAPRRIRAEKALLFRPPMRRGQAIDIFASTKQAREIPRPVFVGSLLCFGTVDCDCVGHELCRARAEAVEILRKAFVRDVHLPETARISFVQS